MGEPKKALLAYGKCPYNRGRNVTLIGAIATKGFLAPFTFEGWTNQEAFLTYVREVLTGAVVARGTRESWIIYQIIKRLKFEK